MNVFTSQSLITKAVIDQYLSHKNFSRPAMIICETVNACNLNCIICAYSHKLHQSQMMSMQLFEKVITDYDDVGGGYISLTPTVGDVFLDSKLYERFKCMEKYPSIKGISVTTNAVLAKKLPINRLEFILANLCKIHISIYGLDAEEYHQMSRKNKFSEMLESVRLILKICNGTNKVNFGFRLLNKKTHTEITDWIHENFGCDIPFGETTTYANWGILDTSKKLPGDATWLPIHFKKGQCAIPLLALQIASNGDVSFCPCDDFQHNEELNLGNISHITIKELYNSEKVKNLYNFENYIPKFCRTCSFHQPIKDSVQIEKMCRSPLDYIGG